MAEIIDYFHNKVSVGNEVAAIKTEYGKPPKVVFGTVCDLLNNGVTIKTAEGNLQSRFSRSRCRDNDRLLKVACLGERSGREEMGEDRLDMTGYPIREGDKVLLIESQFRGDGDSFDCGTVVSFTAKKVKVAGMNPRQDPVARDAARLLVIA